MTAFASVQDLEDWMGLDIVNVTRAEALLDAATEEIRGAIGQTIDSVTDDTVTVKGSGGEALFLPQLPVTSVSEVKVDGTVLDPSGYVLEAAGLLRRVFPDIWVSTTEIEVTYDHGYTDIPDDIAAVCKDMASRAMVAAGMGQSEEGLLGPVAIAEAVGFGPTVVLLPSERRVIDRYSVRDWN